MLLFNNLIFFNANMLSTLKNNFPIVIEIDHFNSILLSLHSLIQPKK